MTDDTGKMKCHFCKRNEASLRGDAWQAFVKCGECEARGPRVSYNYCQGNETMMRDLAIKMWMEGGKLEIVQRETGHARQ